VRIIYATSCAVLRLTREHRLKFINKLIRAVNLGWIIFCAVMIELTLNENHMLLTLSKWGNIAFPAQLVPLLVGVLSFARVLWLMLMDWADEEAPSGEEPGHPETHPHRTAYVKTLRGGLRLLPPWTKAAKKPRRAVAEPENMKDRHKPIHYRFLVGYLPWLSVFPFWRRELRDIENPSPADTPEKMADIWNTDTAPMKAS